MVRVCRDPTITGFVEVEPEFQGQRALVSDVGSSEAKTSHEWCECTIYHFKRIDSKSTIYVDALIEWGQVSLGHLKLTEEHVKQVAAELWIDGKEKRNVFAVVLAFSRCPGESEKRLRRCVNISNIWLLSADFGLWGVGEAEIVKKPLFQTFRLTSTGWITA